jgi:hypothetical protein
MGILPYSGIKFFVYQKFKRSWADAHPSPADTKPPMYASLAFGATAGVVAQTLTYPLDVVRRRMQVCLPHCTTHHRPLNMNGSGTDSATQRCNVSRNCQRRLCCSRGPVTLHHNQGQHMQVSNIAAGPEGANASVLKTTQTIIAQQGWQGLFRGVYLNWMKVAPATAVGFAVYDFLKDALGLENHL